MTNFKEIQISEIFDIIGENSKLTKTFIEDNKGDFPVFSGETKNGGAYGYINFYKHEEEILIWTTYGDAGNLRIVNGKFNIGRNASGVRIKDEFKNKVYFQYVKYLCEIYFKLNAQGGKGELRKLPQQRVKDIFIKLPINENGEFDFEKQKEIALKYEKLEKLKDRIRIMKEDLENQKIEIESFSKEIKVGDIFDIIKGKSIYTRTFINNNIGEFSVFSSQTSDDGIIGRINSYDFDNECITWTTDGVYAGTVFLRKNYKFSMTTHCGALILLSKYISILDLKYIFHYLRLFLKGISLGNDNKRITSGMIKDFFVKIPTNTNGEFDLEKQKEIALKYEKIEKIQKNLIEELEYLEKVKVEI